MPRFVPAGRRPAFDLSNTLFTASLFCMLIAEAFMIRRLWFSPFEVAHPHRGLDLPFLIWIPAFFVFVFLQVLRKQTREGRLHPVLADKLCTGFSLLLLIGNLLMTRFAQIAFR